MGFRGEENLLLMSGWAKSIQSNEKGRAGEFEIREGEPAVGYHEEPVEFEK